MNSNCYQTGKNYAYLRIWWFNPKTRRVGRTTTLTPFKGACRRERYDTIAEELRRAELPVPAYVPAKNEKPQPAQPASHA